MYLISFIRNIDRGLKQTIKIKGSDFLLELEEAKGSLVQIKSKIESLGESL